MILSEIGQADEIFASDGATVHRLMLRRSNGGSAPVLMDAAGTAFSPREVELLRWPPAAEADLRHGGYLADWPWETELWCNCAD